MIITKIKIQLKKHKNTYDTLCAIKNIIIAIYYFIFLTIFKIFKVKNNKIIIISYYGKGYGDSGKYISEKIKNDKNLQIYWATNKKNKDTLPPEIKYVKYNSIKFLYHLSTSKIWINNSRFQFGIIKRKSQFYIQTWHGGLAMKKIEYDAYKQMSKSYKLCMKNDTNMTNVMISNSDFCTQLYKRGFKYTGRILEVGTPRNDIFLSANDEIRKKVFEKYNVDKNHKILLYAPTFRTGENSKNPYNIDFGKLKIELEKKYKCKWVIMIRLHPNIKNINEYITLKNNKNIINVSNYPDIQELIYACEMLITDYSSTMFESMIARKAVLIYANDINEYNKERGVYFKFEELPFPVSNNNEKLIRNINDYSIEKITENYNQFENKIGLKETGNACTEIYGIIKKIIEGKKENE